MKPFTLLQNPTAIHMSPRPLLKFAPTNVGGYGVLNWPSLLPMIAAVLAITFLTGCDHTPPAPQTPAASTNATDKVFETRGVVRSVPEGGRTLVVRHEEIPDYMPKMTMELNVRDTNEIAALERDDEITFQLVATADTHWIQNIQRVGKIAPEEPSTPAPSIVMVNELGPGDELADYELMAETGQPLRFSSLRGQAVAFTFIFSRCPLPDYCPRMNNHFAAARDLILTNSSAPTNWQFLSISFDPEFDSPEVLRNYAKFYRHNNPDRWLFANAPQKVLRQLAPELDLMLAREEGGSISHNLRTVVLDPQGRIHKQFDGNLWTAEELANALMEAARVQ
jgi:protein SCO1/2